MLVAWPRSLKMDVRVWIDFADEPAPGQLFRLRVTTRNQVFGFQRNQPSQKLSLGERRNALDAFEALFQAPKKVPNLENAWPFTHEAGLPVDLGALIGLWRKKSSLNDWVDQVTAHLQGAIGAKFEWDRECGKGQWEKISVWNVLGDKTEIILSRIRLLANCLERLDSIKIPLIRVAERFFKTEPDEFIGDPPLAILFKQIGTGGTPLSDADYVYSLIKHLQPKTFDLVETLHEQRNISCILTATDLVMSSVRLAAVNWEPDGKPVADMDNPSKQEFHRLLKRGDFIGEQFLPLIQPSETGIKIASYFDQVNDIICYRGPGDTGLPKQAFPLLKRALIQVLLRLAQVGYLNNRDNIVRREDVLRLVLFWLIAVSDPSKASRLAFRIIKENVDKTKGDNDIKFGQAIYAQLIAEGAALPLYDPEVIKSTPGLAFSPDNTVGMRGSCRFHLSKQSVETQSPVYHFYRNAWWRPWTYHHPVLLWLQREMIAEKIDTFTDPTAGKDDDTPYDYDHILPYSHWGMWTGVKEGDRLLDFVVERQIWVVGNAIGNIRVWTSTLNRADGDKPPTEKLKLDPKFTKDAEVEDNEREMLLKYSAIQTNEIEDWKEASGKESAYRS